VRDPSYLEGKELELRSSSSTSANNVVVSRRGVVEQEWAAPNAAAPR
jgi:hypothetical protein